MAFYIKNIKGKLLNDAFKLILYALTIESTTLI